MLNANHYKPSTQIRLIRAKNITSQWGKEAKRNYFSPNEWELVPDSAKDDGWDGFGIPPIDGLARPMYNDCDDTKKLGIVRAVHNDNVWVEIIKARAMHCTGDSTNFVTVDVRANVFAKPADVHARRMLDRAQKLYNEYREAIPTTSCWEDAQPNVRQFWIDQANKGWW
ncbi:hypothetical protein VPHD479_0353 [Vibrio phage D479]